MDRCVGARVTFVKGVVCNAPSGFGKPWRYNLLVMCSSGCERMGPPKWPSCTGRTFPRKASVYVADFAYYVGLAVSLLSTRMGIKCVIG